MVVVCFNILTRVCHRLRRRRTVGISEPLRLAIHDDLDLKYSGNEIYHKRDVKMIENFSNIKQEILKRPVENQSRVAKNQRLMIRDALDLNS